MWAAVDIVRRVFRKLLKMLKMGRFRRISSFVAASNKKYSITLIASGSVTHLHILQPQREGDGRQALVVPPLYPAPAASLKPPAPLQIYPFIT
jgi:hypothetical protein